MRSLVRLIDFLVNRCPSCGLSAQTICERCWFDLNESAYVEWMNQDDGGRHDAGAGVKSSATGMFSVATKPFLQRSLYRWDDRFERSARVLRDVILASKESPSREMMRLWGAEFHRRALVSGALAEKRNWVLIPPPGRSGLGENDHAGALATAIGDACGAQNASGRLVSVEVGALERVGDSRRAKTHSQKTKSRAERGSIEFRIARGMEERLQSAEGFIFIDDVIATGATAKAAWVALGRPRNFECWAIAFKVRELLSDELSAAIAGFNGLARVEPGRGTMLE